MKGITDIITDRRSIRSYRDMDLTDEVLSKLLESIRWSPSWANTQCWEVIVVKDKARKEQLREALPGTNPASYAIVQAPVLIVICGKKGRAGYYKGQAATILGDWFMYDLGIATQSLCLTAHDLGLGTVIIGLFDHDRAKTILNVPDEYELVSIIPVGYAAKESPAPKRREINEFTHYDGF
ncbi:MAG: nitroreductase family protein [Deltaproteobacteria bacterium]|nr:nitroreductase family protein [Deltaproteobacteria bacterium]